MTTENREPVRWLDDPSELPADVVDELRSYRAREPSRDELTAVRAALVTRGVAKSVSTTAAPTGLSLQVKLLMALWLATAVLASVRGFVATPPVDEDAVVESKPVLLDPAPVPPVEVAVLAPEPEVPVAAVLKPRAGRARAPGVAPELVVRDPAAELPLLSGARRALSSSPARTLELTTEHALKFPHGVFEQERELLMLEALLRSGDREAARRQVTSFEARFPQSVHLERVRVLSESL